MRLVACRCTALTVVFIMIGRHVGLLQLRQVDIGVRMGLGGFLHLISLDQALILTALASLDVVVFVVIVRSLLFFLILLLRERRLEKL